MMETQISDFTDEVSASPFCAPGAGSWVNIAAAVVEQDQG